MRRTKVFLTLLAPLAFSYTFARTQERPQVLDRVVPLPMALSDDFEFRKANLYLLTEVAPGQD